jgi:hypothetical protein
MALDKNDIAALTTAFENALKGRGIGKTSGSGWGSGGGTANTATSNTISSGLSLDSLKNTASSAAEGISLLTDAAKGSLNTWRELSRNGATFSNDLLGMTLAAANSRVSLDEFSDVIIRNGKQMAGLGGSVTAGAEAFAKFSQGLFDSKMDTQMRNLAYTTKEMNEVMAIHMGNVRSSAQVEGENKKREYQAANKLAIEMDATSKLMGKSREIQMEEMRARQVDMQVQAKIRMEANKMRAEGKSEAEISTYKASVAAALKKATDEGVGQAAKEIFATGTVTSQTGATQAALAQRQVGAVKEQFGAIRSGDLGAAEAAAAKATSEAIKLQNNEQIQSLMTLGAAAGPDIEASLKGMFDATQTMVDSLESIARENSLNLKTEAGRAEAIRIANERILASQTKTAGVTQGALATEKVQQELKAGAAGAITAINASGESIAGALNKVGSTISETLIAIEGPGKSLGAKMAEAAQKGLKPEPITRKEGEGELAFKERQEQASGGPLGSAMVAAVKASNIAVDEVSKVVTELVTQFADTRSSPVTFQTDKAIPVTIESDKTKPETPTVEVKTTRETGSAGTVGKLIEDFGQGTLAMLHGKEGVITEDQLKNLALGIQSEGAATAINSLKSSVPKLDLGGVSKDIKTTFSSVKVSTSTSTTEEGEKTTQLVQNDSAKKAAAQLEKLDSDFEKLKSETLEQVNSSLRKSGIREVSPMHIEAVDPAIKAAREKYEVESKKLQSVIDAGTKWEVTYKKDAAEESKKVSYEERTAKFNDLQAASDQIKENSKLTQQSIKEKKTASQEMSRVQAAELREAQKQAELSKDLIGKNVAGMSDNAISDMIKKSGAKFENFYIDTTKKGETILKSFSADYVEANKKSKEIPDGNIRISQEEYLKRSFEVDAEKERVQKTGVIDPKIIERSMQLGKINLNDSQKKIYDEMMSMSSTAAKQRLESLKEESQAAVTANRGAADAMKIMEDRYEKEGRLAELEHNEEYKRLSEQLSASSNLSKVKNAELTAAKQAADTQAIIAEITGKKTEELKNTQIEAAKEVQKNAELTNSALINAVPTKELTLSTEELTAKLTQGQKNYFNYLLKQDDETIKYKEESTKQQLTLDIEKLKAADDRIESVKAEIQNASTANQKKQLEFKLEGYKQEKTALEESKKYHEEDLETINKAIEAKKKNIDATTQIVEAASEKIEQAKLDVQTVADVTSNSKQESSATAKESAVNKNRILDSEKLRAKAVNKEGKVDLNSIYQLPGMKGVASELKTAPKEPPAASADAKGALNKVAEDKAKAEKEKEAAQAEAAKAKTPPPTAATTKPAENAAAHKKPATLDDVVGSLNRLNTQMSQLITQQSELLNKQIKTTRSSGSSNIYDRVTP